MSEIEVLSEIYNKNIFSYDINEENGYVNGEFTAFNKCKDDNKIKLVGNGNEFRILYLPPIKLKFKLNINSENCKPNISLTSSWLPMRCLKILNNKLLEIINENDESCLWLCFEFLENEAINVITENNGDDLVTLNMNDLFPLEKEDKIEDNIRSLLNFNDSRDENVFKDLIVECEVCLVMKRGNECVKFSACSHMACNLCLMDHFNTRISMGFYDLSCAVCGEELDYAEVRRVMDSHSFERWDTLSYDSCIKSLDDHRACSKCQTFIPINPDDGYGFCKNCRYTFCLDCNQTYNGPKCCHNLTEEDVQLNQQRAMNKRLHTKKSREMYSKELLADSEFVGQKFCPKCFLMFEKNGGCNHMTCPCCKAHFCYLCNKILNGGDPYSHFKNACKLFQFSV